MVWNQAGNFLRLLIHVRAAIHIRVTITFTVRHPIFILVLICGLRMSPQAESAENDFLQSGWLGLGP